jgi:hypothetical protein
MVREITSFLLKIGRCVEHPEIYKVLQRGYISYIYLFFRKSKSFVKTKNKTIQSNTSITIQFKAIQSNSKQFKARQYNSRQYKAIQFKTIQFKAILGNTRQFKTKHHNTRQYKTIQFNSRQGNGVIYYLL